MREIIIKLYKIDELPEKGKKIALQYFRDGNAENGYQWDTENEKSLYSFLDLFESRIVKHYIVKHSNSNLGSLSGLALHKYLWNKFEDKIFHPKQYWICNGHRNAVGTNSKKRESKIFKDSSCPLTGYYMDNVLLDLIIEFMHKPSGFVDFNSLLTQCVDKYRAAVEKDREFQDSEEQIIELANANNYEFTVDGKIFHNGE